MASRSRCRHRHQRSIFGPDGVVAGLPDLLVIGGRAHPTILPSRRWPFDVTGPAPIKPCITRLRDRQMQEPRGGDRTHQLPRPTPNSQLATPNPTPNSQLWLALEECGSRAVGTGNSKRCHRICKRASRVVTRSLFATAVLVCLVAVRAGAEPLTVERAVQATLAHNAALRAARASVDEAAGRTESRERDSSRASLCPSRGSVAISRSSCSVRCCRRGNSLRIISRSMRSITRIPSGSFVWVSASSSCCSMVDVSAR